jgi:hypothetical protein
VLIPYSESLTRKLGELVASLPQDFHLGRAIKNLTGQGLIAEDFLDSPPLGNLTGQGLIAEDVGERTFGEGHSRDIGERGEHRREGLQ